MKNFLLLSFIILCSVVASAQSYTLKYNFEKGKTYLYSDVTVNNLTQQVMGQEMKVNSNSRMVIRLVTEGKSGEETAIIMSLDSAISHTKSPQIDTVMVLENVLNKRTKVFVDDKGYILRREIIDSVESNPMMQIGKRDAMQFTKFPDKPIKVGDTWNITDIDTIEMMGGATIMTNEIQFTLAGKDEKMGMEVLKIPFTSKLKVEGKGNMMGFEFFLEGGGSAKGEYFFSHDKGIPVLTEVSQVYDVTMAATGDQNMIIPISQDVKVTRSLIK